MMSAKRESCSHDAVSRWVFSNLLVFIVAAERQKAQNLFGRITPSGDFQQISELDSNTPRIS
jgi:hypothetical protein